MDISLGALNGACAVTWLTAQVAGLPPLRPLLLLAKALLKEAGLNEVYTGGISSYALVNMVQGGAGGCRGVGLGGVQGGEGCDGDKGGRPGGRLETGGEGRGSACGWGGMCKGRRRLARLLQAFNLCRRRHAYPA